MAENKSAVSMPHNVIIEDRSRIMITGVSDVDSFDEETVVLVTDMGELTIKGQNLHVTKFNVESGEMSIDGMLSAFFYSGEKSKGGFFSRVFK